MENQIINFLGKVDILIRKFFNRFIMGMIVNLTVVLFYVGLAIFMNNMKNMGINPDVANYLGGSDFHYLGAVIMLVLTLFLGYMVESFFIKSWKSVKEKLSGIFSKKIIEENKYTDYPQNKPVVSEYALPVLPEKAPYDSTVPTMINAGIKPPGKVVSGFPPRRKLSLLMKQGGDMDIYPQNKPVSDYVPPMLGYKPLVAITESVPPNGGSGVPVIPTMINTGLTPGVTNPHVDICTFPGDGPKKVFVIDTTPVKEKDRNAMKKSVRKLVKKSVKKSVRKKVRRK